MVDSISGMTRLEVITAALFPIGYKSAQITGELKTHAEKLFDEIMLEICGAYDWRFLRTSATISLSQGVTSYNFQSNSIYVDQLDSVWITTAGSAKRVYKDSYTSFKADDPEGTETGTPQYYSEWGNQLITFDKITNTSYSGLVLYKQLPQMVTADGSYSIIPRQYQHIHVRGIRWRFAADKGDRRLTTFKTDYDEALARAISKEQQELESEAYYDKGDEIGVGSSNLNDHMRYWFR